MLRESGSTSTIRGYIFIVTNFTLLISSSATLEINKETSVHILYVGPLNITSKWKKQCNNFFYFETFQQNYTYVFEISGLLVKYYMFWKKRHIVDNYVWYCNAHHSFILTTHIQGNINGIFVLGLASIDCQQEVSTPFQVEGLTNSEASEWCVATGNGVLSDWDNVLSGNFLGSVQTQHTLNSSSFYWIGSSNQSSRSLRLFPTDQRSRYLWSISNLGYLLHVIL